MRDSCDPGGGIGWLAAGGIPNSLYRVPFFYIFLAYALCYSLYFRRFRFALFLLSCSRWSFADVPLIFSCPAEHVPD